MPRNITLIFVILIFQGCVSQQVDTDNKTDVADHARTADSTLPKQKNQEKPQKDREENKIVDRKNDPAKDGSQEADAAFNRGELAKFEDTLASLSNTLAVVAPPYLSRPTDSSININVMFNRDAEMYFEFGTMAGSYDKKTEARTCKAMEPANTLLSGLLPNTRYVYRMSYRDAAAAGASYASLPEASFETARSPGAEFSFAVQADSHLDSNTSFDAYKTTLGNMLSAKPDFLIDLGDTFMIEKYAQTLRQVELRYIRDRHDFFGIVSGSIPVFFTIGNHDGEVGWATRGKDADMRTWAMKERKLFYPNPEPDDFYTGAADSFADLGLRQSYYAWEWGDALFVVLDPYWYTKEKAKSDAELWSNTLGNVQYEWLEAALAKSKAGFKFVFIHNLVGGLDTNNRGGSEAARYFEWGGREIDGTDDFTAKRPGWELPIHKLFVKYGVSIVFHGHDHQFMKQELDGIVYQLCPQPGQSRPDDFKNKIEEYGYGSGDFVGGTGYISVTVGRKETRVEFIRTFLPGSKTNKNREVAYGYTVESAE